MGIIGSDFCNCFNPLLNLKWIKVFKTHWSFEGVRKETQFSFFAKLFQVILKISCFFFVVGNDQLSTLKLTEAGKKQKAVP